VPTGRLILMAKSERVISIVDNERVISA
jgi:hypothetical protein